MPDVVGIGFANMDVIVHVPDEFLAHRDFQKGHSYYLDAAAAVKILKEAGEPILVPGGSVANSILNLGLLGLDVRMVSRLGQDHYAPLIQQHLADFDVTFSGRFDPDGRISKQCIILVTPDAQRTFVPPDGAANYLSMDDFDHRLLQDAKIVFLEGFMWLKDGPRQVIIESSRMIKEKSQAKIAFTLPDFHVMTLYREDIFNYVKNNVDILFANEEELLFLLQQQKMSDAQQDIFSLCPIVAATKGADGSVIFSKGEAISVSRIDPVQLVDTTGAGDAYAAGFLYGLINGYELAICGELGSLLASEVITVDGGTPHTDIMDAVTGYLKERRDVRSATA